MKTKGESLEKVLLFESTRYAIRAEKSLRSAGFNIKVIPTPRKYSSNCGVSIKFSKEAENEIIAYLQEHKLPFEGPYDL